VRLAYDGNVFIFVAIKEGARGMKLKG